MKNRAVCLVSGGMDSVLTAHIASRAHKNLYFMTFDYGQMHVREVLFAKQAAQDLNAKEHRIVVLDFTQFVFSPLIGTDSLLIPNSSFTGIAPTWVPQRNSIFLAIAFSYAEVIDASSVYIGVSQIDYSGYPDCREEFINSIEDALNLGAGRGKDKRINIEAPLIHTSKVEEIKIGTRLGVDWGKTWTCYRGEELACGTCPSCVLRVAAFKEAGIVDPIKYVEA